jgi:glycopeptide antibiotics resistance protein
VLVNIGGFVPLGFFLYAYLSLSERNKLPALVTILFGCLLSLTVEIAQAYIPTRDSGMTDVITNTTGTALGVVLFRFAMIFSGMFRQSRLEALRSLAMFLPSRSVRERETGQRVTARRGSTSRWG